MDAIDKKENFPVPRTRPVSSSASSAKDVSSPAKSGSQSPAPTPHQNDAGKAKSEPVKVITPQMRQLLSRNIEVLARKEVSKNGDGFLK